ncbi:MAG: molybdopterin molybdotransferase MoeA [Bauldia litoralis]
MAQLSDDCFAHDRRLTPLDEALDLLRDRLVAVTPVGAAPLIDCAGRILAEDIVSDRAVPPHDNSAVDGYAVFFDDLDPDSETELPVAGRLAAGEAPAGPAARGTAIRIFTGAPMPDGPDTVMMQEDCIEADGRVRIPPGIKRGANRRSAGEDVAAGATVLTGGQRLRPQDLGLAASIGLTALPVHAPLSVALFSTGDELRDPGEATPPGTVYDANRFALGALLRGLGCRVTDLGILRDDRETIAGALGAAAAGHDLVLTSGGVSVGEEDHVRAAVESQGHIHFWRLAIKPGRPVALGQIGATPFLGLPGNPVAVMVTFLRFARPLILRLMGAADPAPALFRVRANFDHKKKKDRREWVRARLTTGADGVPVADKVPRQGAGVLSSMVAADGLVELPEALTYLEKGTMVDFLPFSEVGA